MAQAVVVTYGEVRIEGRAAQPVYVDNSLPAVGPARNVIVVPASHPRAGGPAMAVVNVTGTLPGVGPALPVYIVDNSVLDVQAYTTKVAASGPIAYWPMAEASGTTALDASGNGRTGAYTAVTLGRTGIGDGRTAAGFDGTTSFNNIFSASLAAAFSGQEGTLAAWCQVSASGVWTDGAVRQVAEIRADANNFADIIKNSTNNQAMLRFRAAGTAIMSVNLNSMTTTGWFHVALTWSRAADEFKGYLSGTQSGATQNGLSLFAGSPANTSTLVGALSTAPTQVWSGNLAHVAVWARPLSATEIATLATVASP